MTTKSQLCLEMIQSRKVEEEHFLESIQGLKEENESLQSTIFRLEQQQSIPKEGDEAMKYLVAEQQIEKLKKELDRSKKNENRILNEKSSLNEKFKEFEDEVVKCKQTIANLMNTIYESGDERLMEEAGTLI